MNLIQLSHKYVCLLIGRITKAITLSIHRLIQGQVWAVSRA